MNIGMLWFDNDPKIELNYKIKRAAKYYFDKYGSMPTVCFIHPCMMPEESSKGNQAEDLAQDKVLSGGVEIRFNKSILPNHFWIGVNGIKTPTGP